MTTQYIPSVASPRQSRAQKLAVLAAGGYAADRIAALTNDSPLPPVGDDIDESIHDPAIPDCLDSQFAN